MTHSYLKSTLALATLIALPTLSWAGTTSAPAAVAAPAEKPSITGNLSLNLDSHFVSFGADTWGGGDGMRHLLFHPSLELNKAVTDNFKLILGTWWDVNDQATSSIGNRVQEVDVWFGGAYTTGILTTTVLYQQWMYNSLNEQAVELKLAVDTFLKPYVLIHERLATDYNDGTVAILGASYDFKAGPVSFSVPAAVEVESSGYHGGKKAGIGYGSLGLTGSVPVEFIAKGASFSVGVTGYATNNDLFVKNGAPSNPAKSFLTYTTGFSIPF
jgi:hypothetical protein